MHREFAEAAGLLQDDYSALQAIDQRGVEAALTALLQKGKAKLDTAEVCRTISRALERERKDETSVAAHDLITDYVTDIARVWRQHGLRPARARNPLDDGYYGRFHRFVDLVLTSVVDPWSKRHDGDGSKRIEGWREAHTHPLADTREDVAPRPRRGDVWLVADDHLQKALARIQKTTPLTP